MQPVGAEPAAVYRAMLMSAAGRPIVGAGANHLGVRVPTDIRPDSDGRVAPLAGGMSVAPEPSRLPLHLRPARLGGVGALPVFGIAVVSIGDRLSYRADPRRPTHHGFIEPATMMTIDAYQAALAESEPRWKEEP